MIAIQKIGGFLSQDKNGFIVNDLNYEKLDEDWKKVIQAIIEAYQKHLTHRIHSIYLRGTVARNVAVKGFSDIDTFALVHSDENIRWQKAECQPQIEKIIQSKFNFVSEVEVNISSYVEDFYLKNPRLAMIIQTQSLCVFGKSIAPTLPLFRPNAEMRLVINWLETDIQEALYKIKHQKNTLEDCQAIMKIILRAGFELVMERAGKYTTDLYWCYFVFSKYYPKHKSNMKQALIWYLNPITDSEKLTTFLLDFGDFLTNQTKEI